MLHYQQIISLGQSPVTSASSASTSSKSSLFLLRSDVAGLKEGSISEEVLKMTQVVTQYERDAINLTQTERLCRLEDNVGTNMQFKATFEDSLTTVVSASHLEKLVRKANDQAKSLREKYQSASDHSRRAKEIHDGLELSKKASLHCITTTLCCS